MNNATVYTDRTPCHCTKNEAIEAGCADHYVLTFESCEITPDDKGSFWTWRTTACQASDISYPSYCVGDLPWGISTSTRYYANCTKRSKAKKEVLCVKTHQSGNNTAEKAQALLIQKDDDPGAGRGFEAINP